MTERHQRESDFAQGIDIEQAVHCIVDETAYYFCRQTQGSGDRQQIGEQSAVIPAEMAVGAVLIFPGVAPVSGGAHDGQRSVSDGRLVGRSFSQDAAIVSGAQAAQSKLGGGEVIDAGFEVGPIARTKISADQIELDLVERSGAGRGAKVYLAAGIFPVPGYASGEIEELGDPFQVRLGRSLRRNDLGDGGKSSDSGLADLGGERRWIQRGVNLERDRLVVEVEGMLVVVDAGVGVLGGGVIGQGGVSIVVVGHVRSDEDTLQPEPC